MKKLGLPIIITVIISCLCASCSDSDKEPIFVELSSIDFGEGTYRPNPFKFLDNLPPFSWLGMPDSVKKETELEISFNEDAIRSNSSAQLAFVDQNGNYLNSISFDKSSSDKLIINAKSGNTIVPVSFTVNPAVGDSILHGSIIVIGNDLDKVNNTKLSSMASTIGSWTLNHKIGINWLRWTILVLIAIIIIATISYIFYLLFNSFSIICKFIYSKYIDFANKIHQSNKFKDNFRKKDFKKDKKNENKSKGKKRNQFIENCERILLNPSTSVSDKATTLERLFTFWDYDLPESEKNFEASLLDRRVAMAMDELWAKYYNYTKKRMNWSGTALDSMLVPIPETTPPNKNYSNIDNLTWGEIMKKHNYPGMIYQKGKPLFYKIANIQL